MEKEEHGHSRGCEMCRTRRLNDIMRIAEGRHRIDRDEEMRQDKRARVEMDAGDGHDKPVEALEVQTESQPKYRWKKHKGSAGATVATERREK